NVDWIFVAAASPVLHRRAPTGNTFGPAFTLLLSSPTVPQVIGVIASDGASETAAKLEPAAEVVEISAEKMAAMINAMSANISSRVDDKSEFIFRCVDRAELTVKLRRGLSVMDLEALVEVGKQRKPPDQRPLINSNRRMTPMSNNI